MTDRDDIIRALCAAGYAAYSQSMCGDSNYARNYRHRVRKPQIGDLVVEQSSLWLIYREGSNRKTADQVGTLKKVETGTRLIEEEDGAMTEVKYGPVYHIETFDGDTITWDNAGFIAIPRTPHDLIAWEKGENHGN